MAVWINAGVLLLTGVPEAPSHGAVAIPIWIGSLVLLCAVFVLLAVITMTTDIVRLRKPRAASSGEDQHGTSDSRLGVTMADGGTPVETTSAEELWLDWDPEFLSLRGDSEDP